MLKIKFNKQFFLPGLILLFVISIGFFVFSPTSFKNIAIALQGDYGKPTTGGSLTVDDWNLLDSDFLDKESFSGDTMAGPLTLPATSPVNPDHATTKDYVDNKIVDTSSNDLKIVCGSTIPGASGWSLIDAVNNRLQIDIVTTSAGFTQDDVKYFTSIGGLGYHLDTTGANSIFVSDKDNLRLRIRYLGTFSPFTESQVESWNWYIQWCGVGR